MHRALIVVLALCACGKKRKEVDPCGAAGEQFATLRHAEKANEPASKIKVVGNKLAGQCRGDIWNDAAIKCIRASKTVAEATACRDKLSPDDRESFDVTLVELDPTPMMPDDCKAVVDHMVELDKAGRDSLTGEERIKADKQVASAAEAMLATCRETSWSKEMTDCMIKSATFDEGEACGEHLTQEQKDAWAQAALGAAVSSATTGSATAGSATAGSAQ